LNERCGHANVEFFFWLRLDRKVKLIKRRTLSFLVARNRVWHTEVVEILYLAFEGDMY
jgi:hypothetical protein